MKKSIFLLFIILIFSGCETKINNILQQDNQYINLMQHTKRGQIVNSLNTIALINATYLNPVLKNSKKIKESEIFIIGVYNSIDNREENQSGIFNPNYNLTMNNSKWEKAEIANKNELELYNYPFYNKWMRYYKVYFPKTDENEIILTYKHKTLGEVNLTFNSSQFL